MKLFYERGPVQIYHGDCLEWLPSMENAGIAVVVTDPPYGCGKADWDSTFPTKWFASAAAVSKSQVIITGSAGLKDSVPLVGDSFVDVLSARNLNGMTRGPIGFGNWLSAVLSGSKPKMGPNVFEFTVGGDMPNHPSPKPLDFMVKLVARVSEADDLVCDPFTGSGSTAIACIKTGRRFVGCEIDEAYCEEAARRCDRELDQGRLFEKEPEPVAVQRSLLG